VESKQGEGDLAGGTVIPVVQEEPVITKRTVETGRLRVDRKVSEREVVLDEPLLRHEVRIERVSIGREVPASEQLPRIRYEGETMVVPVLEEVPLVVKKVVLAEEIRITQISREYRDPQHVQVKVEEVSVERVDDASAGTPTNDESASMR
jgi:stress response protein YsnF